MQKYTESQAGIELGSKPGRAISGGVLFSTGGFYGGTKIEITPSVQWKLNRHFTFVQFLSTNFVDLPEDSFTLHLLRSQISYSLDTHLSASALVQYDNSSRELGLNLRIGYLFREGTELFIVYDELNDKKYGDKRRLLMKFTYLFAF